MHSYLNYGLSVWGLANNEDLEKIRVVQNKAIRAIAGVPKHESCSKNYNDLGIIKLNDMFSINVLKFVWDFENNEAPNSFDHYFKYANTVHGHSTRFSQKNKFCKDKKYRTNRHGLRSFTNVAITISNDMKDFSWFYGCKTKASLIRKLKQFFSEKY